MVCPIFLGLWCHLAAAPLLTWGWQWHLSTSLGSCVCFWVCVLFSHGWITCGLSSSKGAVGLWRGESLHVPRVALELHLCCDLCRLDEDGKVLTPEELLYRVSAALSPARAQLLMWGSFPWRLLEGDVHL